MSFSFFASLPHYVDHLAPLWFGLDDSERSVFWGKGSAYTRAVELGIEARWGTPRPHVHGPDDLFVVAAHADYVTTSPRPVVFVQHGIGQSYFGDERSAGHPAYAGGRDRDRVVLFLEPNYFAASKEKEAWPGAQVHMVGVPLLDPWHSGERGLRTVEGRVAVTFHSHAQVCNETTWAFPYFRKELMQLAEQGRFDLLGHGHPRTQRNLSRFWQRNGVPFTNSFEEVLDDAACLVFDNTSAGYFFASLGKPVVVLSPPWYRRNVDHGLRFWDSLPGMHVTSPENLRRTIEVALEDPAEYREQRERAVWMAFDGKMDGKATQRSLDAMRTL